MNGRALAVVACAVLAFVLCAAMRPASAHEVWIAPQALPVGASGPLDVHVRVGERGIGEPVPRREARLTCFELRSLDGVQSIEGVDGATPAGRADAPRDGAWIVYATSPAYLELDGDRFESYLAEEGLDGVIRERASRGETGWGSRESYSRNAKSLVGTAGGDALATQPQGLDLELVPLRDPRTAASPLLVQLLELGEPVAGALVRAWRVPVDGAEADLAVAARTDASGVAVLPLDAAGPWFVSAVTMALAPPRTDGVTACTSRWTSVSFVRDIVPWDEADEILP